MSLTTTILTILDATYPDATKMLSSNFAANIASNNISSLQFPLIVLNNELNKDAEIKKNDNTQKNSKVVISFLKQDAPDSTDFQSESIRSEMEDLADKAATILYRLIEIRPNGNQKYKLTPIFHAFSTDLTGVILEMYANENVVINL
jgi:predicted Mrr-cat superfamily restriction endonuclease